MGAIFSKKASRRSLSIPSSSPYPAAVPISHPAPYPPPGPSQKYSFIGDNFNSIEQVTSALRGAGLETSNLIVGIDFTKSNEWTGKDSFNGRSLHAISESFLNPYEQAIQIVGETLSPFDEDNLIPCFGFGDVSTHDQSVFSFYPSGQVCNGFEAVLSRYKEITPHVRLSGPTSFAPIVRVAMDIVEHSGGQYHVLLIIADGQVTRSVDTALGKLSPQEQETIDAIVEASEYALSIVLVGVGDGPWDAMKQFDDSIPRRVFDNFQFVNFTSIMAKNLPKPEREATFALAALMEIPSQYKATMELGLLNRRMHKGLKGSVLPPPGRAVQSDSSMLSFPRSISANQGAPGLSSGGSLDNFGAISESQFCPVCLTRPRDMAFGCGHQTCRECAPNLRMCPLCRQTITTRLRLYT